MGRGGRYCEGALASDRRRRRRRGVDDRKARSCVCYGGFGVLPHGGSANCEGTQALGRSASRPAITFPGKGSEAKVHSPKCTQNCNVKYGDKFPPDR